MTATPIDNQSPIELFSKVIGIPPRRKPRNIPPGGPGNLIDHVATLLALSDLCL
jgi:hypothetical protein